MELIDFVFNWWWFFCFFLNMIYWSKFKSYWKTKNIYEGFVSFFFFFFMSAFHSLIRHKGHNYGCCTRSRKCLPFWNTWFHLWFSKRFMLSCHLCLFNSCIFLVFWIWSLFLWFDCLVFLYFWLYMIINIY